MNAGSGFSKLISLVQFLTRHPRLGLNLLSQAPSYFRGFDYARHWHHHRENSDRPSGADTTQGSANPLLDFFDARTTGRGIWKWLHYFDIYDRHFRKFVGREVRVVEIGVYSGGSLDLWRHYFGNGCRVYGVDIEEACKAYESDHVKIHIGDQANRAFWKGFKETVPPIDVLIDDGGHGAEQQIVTLEEMLPHLRPGGVYVCEDIHGIHNGFSSFAQGLINSLNGMEFVDENLRHKGGIKAGPFQAWIHSVHFYPFLTVLEKASQPLDILISQKRGTEWQPFLKY